MCLFKMLKKDNKICFCLLENVVYCKLSVFENIGVIV